MKNKKPVIVVSGEPGAGSTTIAKEVAKKLRLKFFSPGFIQKGIAGGKNESKASIVAWRTKKGSSKKFHKSLDREQLRLAKKGGIVICGKLSIHFLKDLADLTVWLDVPLKVRAKRSAQRDKIPAKEAEKSIADREKIERKEWRRMYGFDYVRQKNQADLVLNTSNLTVEQSVKKIMDFLKRSENFAK